MNSCLGLGLGGGFKHLLFFTLPGKMIQFDLRIFFKMGWFQPSTRCECQKIPLASPRHCPHFRCPCLVYFQAGLDGHGDTHKFSSRHGGFPCIRWKIPIFFFQVVPVTTVEISGITDSLHSMGIFCRVF